MLGLTPHASIFPVFTLPCTRSPFPRHALCSLRLLWHSVPVCHCVWSPSSPCSGSESPAFNCPPGLCHTVLPSHVLTLTCLCRLPACMATLFTVPGLWHPHLATLVHGHPAWALICAPCAILVLMCSRSLPYMEALLPHMGSDTLRRAAVLCGPPPHSCLGLIPSFGLLQLLCPYPHL